MAEPLDEKIRENAEGPAKASGDAGSVEQHKLADQVAVDKYLKSQEAVKQKHRGLRFGRLVPPGTT